MSLIIGIDPGKTVGLCLYDTQAGRAIGSWQTQEPEHAVQWARSAMLVWTIEAVAIERPRIYQSAGNELCDTIEQTGWLMAQLGGRYPMHEVYPGVRYCGDGAHLLERRAVTNAMTEAMGSTVRGDAGVWQALCALHPDAVRRPVVGKPATRQKPAVCAVEAGPLYGVTSHARAALAVAWALGRYLEAK